MVFVSYSWDSDSHIEKVGQLVNLLKKSGIRTVWDQDLELGKRIPSFMEEGLRKCDQVLFICTPKYKAKADGRDGGVGYETNVITGDLYRSHNDMKYIPVLFDGGWTDSLPVWASGKLGADLRNDNMREFEKLLDALRDPAETAGAEAPGVPAAPFLDGGEEPEEAEEPAGPEERRALGRIYGELLEIKEWLVQIEGTFGGIDLDGSEAETGERVKNLKKTAATYDFILKKDTLDALESFFKYWDTFQFRCAHFEENAAREAAERAEEAAMEAAGKKKGLLARFISLNSSSVRDRLRYSYRDAKSACNKTLSAVAERLS